MRSRRFDRQLQSVFIVLSGLMAVVGLASLGVNRFLADTQQRVLSESIAIIERTERVAQESELASSLAGRLQAAENAAVLVESSAALAERVERIKADVDAMRLFLGGTAGPASTAAVESLVAAMNRTVERRIAAVTAMREKHGRLADSGSLLAALISTEADLARLRITAGIWELYGLPQSGDPRHGLDRLADVNFFAYERLAEMAEAIATLDRVLGRIPTAKTAAELATLGADYEVALSLAQDRVGFMLSRASRERAHAQLSALAQVVVPGGLIAERLAGLAAEAELDGLGQQMGRELGLLTLEVLRGRSETRARMSAGVAEAAWQATLLLLGLAGVLLLALLVAFLVWARARKHVLLRLEEVAGRMVDVAGGVLGDPMPISGKDEIGRLETALNILRERTIEATQLRDRLEAAVIDRTADVVAEMQSANAARADAEEQSRAKTHF
ncbi:MAG: HAMP domain-containing protein [Gemmobacter sp.]|nr:HAMP domain-containing protein [Gemmobacter sp.]